MSRKIKEKKDFRVLIVYPNLPLMLVPALAIGIFTKILKAQGYQVSLFETTGYLPQDPDESSSPENRVKFSQAREFDYEHDLGVVPMYSDMRDDFRNLIEDYKPDFMIFTVVEDAFLQAISLLEAVDDLDIPHLIGGVFPTAAPERCMEFPQINMIGMGEGEAIIPATAEAIRLGENLKKIPGTWYRDSNNEIHKNQRGPLVDINEFQPDFSLIDDRRFYRPMGGRIFRTMPIETYRGCPFTCTFCNSPMQTALSKSSGQGNFLRRKRIPELRDEIRGVVDKYRPEFLYFIDDSFLSRPRKEIFEFCDMYSEFELPFWFNTRPENCTEDVMQRIAEAGAYRISFGLECGNEEYRRKVLLRQVSNKKIIERFEVIAKSGIAFSVNLIIGFPGETRELIMDTVELVRSLAGFDTLTVSIFTPYHGTRLRDVAVRNGWLDPKTITVHTTSNSLLNMPNPYLSVGEIDGLMRVVPLYCFFPKSDWPALRRAEINDEEGNKILAEFMEIYQEQFLGMTQDDANKVFIEGGTGCRSNPKDSFYVSAPRLTESQLISLAP